MTKKILTMTHKTELNISLPNIEDLCCVNCKVNPLDMQDPLIKSLFHCQILTCRLIIYTVRSCIASPSIQNIEDSIHVIVNKEFYASGKLQEHLGNLKMQFTDPEPVHPKIYEACLKYTLTFKLAPLWNSVGKSFHLRGFNFLSLPTNIAALEWNILFKGSIKKLEIIPMRMNLSLLNLESLILPSNIVDNFLTNSKNIINSLNLTLFQCPWVYVLPKLTKARVISVSKSLPDSCPFETYNDLRRHWKNMYSYRLPKTDQGMLFYEVVFPINPNQYFTYPEMCILSKMPEILMCEDKNKIASEFVKDLSKNVHSICGEVINIGHQYPEIDIEYSYTLKRKKTNSSDTLSDQLQSPFFTTPTDTNIIPANGRVDLSSLFTFKGMNKMRSPMRKHSEQVLSIMGNQKQKKKMSNDNYQLVPQAYPFKNRRNPKLGYNPMQNMTPKTDFAFPGKLDDVISYRDLPYMKSNREKHKEDQHSSKSINTLEELPGMHSNYSKTVPKIKNIENVQFDLKAFKQIRAAHENELKNLSGKIASSESSGISSMNNNTVKKQDFEQNSNHDQFVRNKLNSLLYSDHVNFMSQNENKSKKQHCNDNENPNTNGTELFDDEIRAALSKFDSDNNYFKNNCEIETTIDNKQDDSFSSCNEMRSLEEKLNNRIYAQSQNKQDSPEKIPKVSIDDFEVPTINDTDLTHCNSELSYNLSSHSPSLLNKRIRQKNIDFVDYKSKQSIQNKDATIFDRNKSNLQKLQFFESREHPGKLTNDKNCGNQEQESGKFSSFFETNYNPGNNAEISHERSKNGMNENEGGGSRYHKVDSDHFTENDPHNSIHEKMEHKNSNDSDLYGKNVFDISQISVSTLDMFEGSINRKLLQNTKFHNDKTDSIPDNTRYKESLYNESQYSPSIFESHEKQKKIDSHQQDRAVAQNLKSIQSSGFNQQLNTDSNMKWKTSSSSPINFSRMEMEQTSGSSLSFLKVYNDMQDKAMELTQSRSDPYNDSDFLSILSQSSNESDSANYENYKQAYTESLSFN